MRIILIAVLGLSLIGCTSEPEAEPIDDNTTVFLDDVENQDFDIYYASGVNGDRTVFGDSQNYISIVGLLGENIETNKVSLIDYESGIVLGSSPVNEFNEFYIYSNMQGADEKQIILSLDESVEAPKVADPKLYLKEGYRLVYMPNIFTKTNLNAGDQEAKEVVNKDDDLNEDNSELAQVGETAEFDSEIRVKIDAIELTNEEPNGIINNNFVRVDFTINNLSSEPITFTASSIDLYDANKTKAERNAKGFYWEEIAVDMQANGSVYFDSKTEGPFYAVVGNMIWKSD